MSVPYVLSSPYLIPIKPNPANPPAPVLQENVQHHLHHPQADPNLPALRRPPRDHLPAADPTLAPVIDAGARSRGRRAAAGAGQVPGLQQGAVRAADGVL